MRNYKIHLLLFSVFFLFFTSITAGTFWEIDGQNVYLTTKSIVDRGHFEIECINETVRYQSNCYSKYGLFASLSLIPFYIPEKLFVEQFHLTFIPTKFFPSFSNVIFSSLLIVLLFQFLLKIGFSEKYSIIGSILFGVCTYIPVYTKTLFPEPLITLLIYGGFYSLFFSKTQKGILISGILFGLAFLTKFGVFIFFPCIIYLMHIKKYNLKQIFLFLIPLLISLLIFFSYNFIRLGNVFDAGYRGIDSINHPFLLGLYLNTFSPGKGLFLYQPIIMLAFWGLKRFKTEQPLIFTSLLIFTLINFIFYSGFQAPTGDLTWGTRYIYPTIPFFIICLVYFLKYNRSMFLRNLFVFLIIISFFIQASAYYLDHHRYRSYIFKKLGYDSNYTVYLNPQYSPLVGQWRMIFNLGYTESEKSYWKEAFQEQSFFTPSYTIATPDIILLRSKFGVAIFITLLLSSLLFVNKLFKMVR